MFSAISICDKHCSFNLQYCVRKGVNVMQILVFVIQTHKFMVSMPSCKI